MLYYTASMRSNPDLTSVFKFSSFYFRLELATWFIGSKNEFKMIKVSKMSTQ